MQVPINAGGLCWRCHAEQSLQEHLAACVLMAALEQAVGGVGEEEGANKEEEGGHGGQAKGEAPPNVGVQERGACAPPMTEASEKAQTGGCFLKVHVAGARLPTVVDAIGRKDAHSCGHLEGDVQSSTPACGRHLGDVKRDSLRGMYASPVRTLVYKPVLFRGCTSKSHSEELRLQHSGTQSQQTVTDRRCNYSFSCSPCLGNAWGQNWQTPAAFSFKLLHACGVGVRAP